MPGLSNVSWPGWDVVRKIGAGSFGAVYEIQRENFGQIEQAALKVITIPQSKSDIEELLNDGYDIGSITTRYEEYLKDIVGEYSLMARMKGHSNVVYCDDLKYEKHDDGIGWDIYIKMELLEALPKTLKDEISEERVIKLGKDICNALRLCKEQHIVHRDIKPQNIFVSKDGIFKLGDFGIAKTAERTTSGTKVGTYKYMAPEVYKSEPYGTAADIYSLGLVMYWLLNERRTPFLPLPPQVPTSQMEDDARRRRFTGEQLPPPAHGSRELQEIVLKACAYDPKERYHSADELLAALNTLNSVSAEVIVGPISATDEGKTEGAFYRSLNTQKEELPEVASDELTSGTIGIFNGVPKQASVSTEDTSNEKVHRHWGILTACLALVCVLAFAFKPSPGGKPISDTTIQETVSDAGEMANDPDTCEIIVKSLPVKTEYTAGELLDTRGLQLSVNYADGQVKQTHTNFSCTPRLLRTAGTQTITVRYGGLTTTFDVTVKEEEKEETQQPSQQAPDTTPQNVQPTQQTPQQPVQPQTPQQPAQQQTPQQPAQQQNNERTPVKLRATYKDVYTLGESLGPSNLMLTVIYDDNSEETVVTGYTCTPDTFMKTGSQVVTISYKNLSSTFVVTVEKSQQQLIEELTESAKRTITSVHFSPPTKTTYIEGEMLDISGAWAIAQYSDGSTEDILSKCQFSPTALFYTESGRQYITVTFNGEKIASFHVNVTSPYTTTTPPQDDTFIIVSPDEPWFNQ